MGVEIEDHTAEVMEELNKSINRALEAIGITAEGFAKLKCPVDTGNLRNSISHTTDGDRTVYIGTNVEYAAYVEFGTVHTPAQPYLQPAITDHNHVYSRIIVQEMRK